MVTNEGTIKIADFGIAKAVGGSGARLTRTGTSVGTPEYMAPEQVMGTGVTPSTDLYATGVIAFELLTGRAPYEGFEPVPLLLKHVHDPVPDVRALRPDIGPRLAAWVSSLLAKKPEERPATAEEAWYALEEVVISVLGPRWRRDARLLDTGDYGLVPPDTPEPAVFPVDRIAVPDPTIDTPTPDRFPAPPPTALAPPPPAAPTRSTARSWRSWSRGAGCPKWPRGSSACSAARSSSPHRTGACSPTPATSMISTAPTPPPASSPPAACTPSRSRWGCPPIPAGPPTTSSSGSPPDVSTTGASSPSPLRAA
jgi:serine/threonine protein kinase